MVFHSVSFCSTFQVDWLGLWHWQYFVLSHHFFYSFFPTAAFILFLFVMSGAWNSGSSWVAVASVMKDIDYQLISLLFSWSCRTSSLQTAHAAVWVSLVWSDEDVWVLNCTKSKWLLDSVLGLVIKCILRGGGSLPVMAATLDTAA